MVMAFLIPRLTPGYDFCILWEFFLMNNFSKPQQISLGLQNRYKIDNCYRGA